MKREIKFRAWLKEEELMCDVLQLLCNQRIGIDICDSGPFVKRPDEFELMQYTGLEDKIGKEIYEGDILKEDNGNVWEIVWYKTGLQMKAIGSDVIWFTLQESCELRILEIIGNIYDNPELLKP